jgi:hypothetical protein
MLADRWSKPAMSTGHLPAGLDERVVSPRQITEARMTPNELLDRLSGLLPAQFEDVLFQADIPPGYLSGPGAPQKARAIEAIRYLGQQGQLEQLAPILLAVMGGGPTGAANPS